MRGLTIILVSNDPARFAAALRLASANAALGGQAQIYADADAVPLLNADAPITDARELGVRFIACQTGLHDAAMTIRELAEGVETGGLISVMSAIADDRLITI